MNYWPVEVTNLSELSAPLTNLIEHLYITGKSTAKEFYGAHGWVVHHNSDLWALSNPVGNLGNGRSEMGELVDGCQLAEPAPVGALFIYTG